jgi:hypothetical protein
MRKGSAGTQVDLLPLRKMLQEDLLCIADSNEAAIHHESDNAKGLCVEISWSGIRPSSNRGNIVQCAREDVLDLESLKGRMARARLPFQHQFLKYEQGAQQHPKSLPPKFFYLPVANMSPY